LRISAAEAKNLAAGIVSTVVFGGVFMSMPGSTAPTIGSMVLPQFDREVILSSAWILFTAA
jgi:hypothetical protein